MTAVLLRVHVYVLRLCVTSKKTVLELFGLMMPFCSEELLRTPKNLCLCGLYLSIFTILGIKTEKLKKNLLIH